MLKRWPSFTHFLTACPRAGLLPVPWDGTVCLTNNAAERALRGIAVGRRNWTFAGSDEGGWRAAAMYALIETAKLNDVDPPHLRLLPDACDAGSAEAFQSRRRRDADLHRLMEKAISDTVWGAAKVAVAAMAVLVLLHIKEILAWFGKP